MNIVFPGSISRGADSLFFVFSYTKNDEDIDYRSFSTNYVITKDGDILSLSPHTSTSSVTIIGGDNSFLYEKSPRFLGESLLTPGQIIALSQIMLHAGRGNSDMKIDSSDDYLLNITNSLFRGYAD